MASSADIAPVDTLTISTTSVLYASPILESVGATIAVALLVYSAIDCANGVAPSTGVTSTAAWDTAPVASQYL